MGSGFLLAIVLGLWAVVLYPTVAKQRIKTNETKSIENFNKTLKSISELAPLVNSEKSTNLRSSARRRRNITYSLFVLNVTVIIVGFMGYYPEYFSLIPMTVLLTWLVVAFIAAQKIKIESEAKIQKAVIRKNYVVYKKPIEPKVLIKPDPERDLIIDERPFEKIILNLEQENIESLQKERRAKGA